MKRLFIVDDDEDILLSLQIWFQKKGFDVEVFSLPQPLYMALETSLPGLILLDVNLGNADGREICKTLKESHLVNCPILLFSANQFMLNDYKKYLADGAFHKPFSLKEITSIITSFTEAS